MCHRQQMGTKLTLAAMIFGQEEPYQGGFRNKIAFYQHLFFFSDLKSQNRLLQPNF